MEIEVMDRPSEKQVLRDLAQEATRFCINEAANKAWIWEDKFAELIIRRCAEVADENPYEDVGNYILKYFGLQSQD